MNKVDPKAVVTPTSIETDAPIDGKPHGRQDGAWSDAVLYDAPSDFIIYGRQNEQWVEAGGAAVPPTPAGDTAAEIGIVWVPPRDGTTQALVIDQSATPTGQLTAPPATDLLLGSLLDAPLGGLPHARKHDGTKWIWEPTVAAGLQITGLIPDSVIIPSTTPITVHAYGAEFTATTVAVKDGVDQATTIISATELTFVIDPTPETVNKTVTITVRDTAVAPPGTGAGAEGFEFNQLVEALYRGRWEPAANNPDIVTLTKEDEWMWVADVVDPLVPETPGVALPGYTGTIKEGDHIVWDQNTAIFKVISPAGGGKYQGRWQPATNTPDIVTLTPKQNDWMWVADIVDPAVPETPLVALPGYTGTIKEGDHVIWDAATSTFLVISSGSLPYHFGKGLSFDDTTRVVDLQPAGPTANLLGGVYAPAQSATQGLVLDVFADPATHGQITVPLATDLLAGAIVEPLPDDLKYVRTRTPAGVSSWTLADARTLHLEFLVPNHATIGSGQQVIEAHGHKFTATSVVLFDGVAQPTTFVSESELLVFVNPTTETVRTMVVSVNDSGNVGTGDAPFYFTASDKLYQGTWEPVSNTPDILTPPKGDKWMWLVDTTDPRKEELVPTTIPGIGGMTTREGDQVVWDATAATFRLVGTRALFVTEIIPNSAAIGSPEIDVQLYGTGFTATTTVLWEGLPVATQFLDTTKLRFKVNPSATPLPTRGFAVVGVRDTVGPVEGQGSVGFLFGDQMYDFGTGLSVVPGAPADPPGSGPDDPPIVHLQPAADSPAGLGGVYVVERTRTAIQGLELNGDGELKAPLASDLLAGTFTEPPQDGIDYSRKYDAAAAKWIWEPALTPGLHISEIVPDKALINTTPAPAPVIVHVFGGHFTATTVVMVDGVDQATTLVSVNEVTYQALPANETVEKTVIVTVKDTAPVAPDTGVGAGADAFDFIVSTTSVDYGRGLTVDTATTPPTVNLDTANTNGEIGGTIYVGRGPNQGLEYDVVTGLVTAPLATNVSAGSIVEPGPDGKQYARVRSTAGVSTWVEVTASAVIVSDTVPTPQPPDGSLWFESDTGAFYILFNDGNSTQWVEIGGGGGSKEIFSGDTPPATPVDDTCWFESDTGAFHVRYNDGNSSQWVEVGNASGGGKEIFSGDTPPATPADNTLWFDSTNGNLYVRYNDGTSAQWVMTDLGEAPMDGQLYARRDATWAVTTTTAVSLNAVQETRIAKLEAHIVALEARIKRFEDL